MSLSVPMDRARSGDRAASGTTLGVLLLGISKIKEHKNFIYTFTLLGGRPARRVEEGG